MLEAVFTRGVDEIEVSGLTQWDRGQKINITSPDSLPSIYQVHFTFKGGTKALNVLVTDSTEVEIPDELLTQPRDLIAYVYFIEEDGSGETVKTINLPVMPRAKPEDYTELPPSYLERVDAMLVSIKAESDKAVADVKQAVNASQEAVNIANTALSNAQTAVSDARKAAQDAKEAQSNAEAAVHNVPYIGDNGNWYEWDADVDAFVDTGRAAQGEQGEPFTYDDFTEEQLAGLKGGKGDTGTSIVSIVRTSGTGAPGTTDTYTITLSDGSKSTFQVYNGANGEGAGDMTAAIYDPQKKATDVFKYADDKVKAITPESIGAAKAAVYSTGTMLASGWTADGEYSFEADYPSDQYNISIEVANTATVEQFEAFGGAMICGSVGSNIATAIGDVPTVDIPIIIKVVMK